MKAGFALIVTLTLMILLTVVAVGLLSLSSVALRSSSQGKAQSEARSNARMAMQLALGELQAELGPDRRVNGPASLDAEALPGHGQWLASYDAWRAEETQRPEAGTRFRRYLVSGERSALANRDAAKAALPGESIEILGAGTLGSAVPADRVKVGLMKVESPQGRYAWWISDENSKAKINAGRDAPDTVTPELLALQSADSAPGSGFRIIAALAGLQVTGREPWELGDDLRTKSISLASADLLPGAASPIGRHFHDLSTVSGGLLTDVRNGRLQRDLSLFLDRPHDQKLRQPLYTVGSSAAVNFQPDLASAASLGPSSGITMEELWLYYNLYKEVDYKRPASNDDKVGRRPAGFPTLLSGNSRDAVIIDKFYPYKRRVYSQLKYMLSLAASPSATAAGKFDLRIAIDPVVILWNPYNVALEYQTGGFTTVGFTGLPYDAVFTTPNGTVSVPFNQFFDYRNVNLIQGSIGREHAIVLQPGESRVFSRVDGRGDNLSSGWRYTEGTLLNHATFPKALSRDASVRLTIRPSVSGGYINYLTQWFGQRSSTPALQSGTVILRGDTALGDLPTITTPQSITVGNIVDDKKIPQMLMSQHMRTETDNRTPSKTWIWNNPSVSFRIAADSTPVARMIHQMELQVTQVSTWENPHVQITPGNQAYWGGGVRADFGVPFFTLRSVPLVPIKSIAAFQHSCANGFRRYWKDSGVSVPAFSFPSAANSLDGHRYLAPLGSKLIGNSFSHPLIPAGKTHDMVMAADDQSGNPGAAALPVADHAYLANAALWDSWYFSSLTPQTTQPFGSNTRSLRQVFDDFFTVAADVKPVPLPSARMLPYRSGNDAALRSLIQSNTPSADAYRKLAGHLMVDGAFNVNSTSVNAWKVMLGSLRGHATGRLANAASGVSLRSAVPASTPVSGLLIANGELSTPTAITTDPTQWNGYRSLGDSEIEALATALVAEIKKRGPFLCLSDFINRRPGSNLEFARQGALQAAITAAGLNGDLEKGNRTLGAGDGSRAAGIPGYISQADLLTSLGPALRARSDTFTIRTYGSATDRNGKVLSEAWCEAVVQRVPGYVDPVDTMDLPDTQLTSPVNRSFGRKFEVIGFRWLNRGEV